MKITSSGDVTIIVAADDQTKEAIEAAKKRLGELGSHTESTLSKMKSQWLAIVGVLYTVKKAYDWAQEGANYQAQMNQMDALARKHNETAESILNDLRKITDGEIANADLVAVSAETMLKGLNPDQIKEFAKYADGLGKTLGIDDVAAFRAMTDAAISGRGAWKLGAMEAKDLDSVLGSQVNTMSDVEKAQARVTVMLKLMKQEFGQTSQEVKAASDIYDQVNAKFSNLWMSIKNFIAKYGVMVIAGWSLITAVFNQGIANMLYGAEKLLNFAASLPGGTSLLTKLFGGANPTQVINHIGTLGKSFSDTAYNAEKFAQKSYDAYLNYDKFSGSIKAGTDHVDNNTKAKQELTSAQAQWNAQVEALNPLIDTEDKQVISLNKSMTDLIQKYGNAAWIRAGYTKALAYLDHSEAIKQNEEKQKLDDAYLKDKEEKFLNYLTKVKKYEMILAQETSREKARGKGERVLNYTPMQEAELAGAQETKAMLDELNKKADEYSKEKYFALQDAITDIHNTQVEMRMTYFKLTYTKAFEEMIGMANQLGGELGKAFGTATANMKEITDIQKNLDPYGEQIVKLQENIDAKTGLMRELGFTELEIENATWEMKVQQDQLYQQQRLQMAASTFGMMAGLANAYYQMSDQKSKAAFTAYKAFAIAQALISTYLAATKALASVPYPFSIVAMLMTIAMGLMQVKQIAAQKMGGSESSSYGGTGSGGGYSYSNPSTSTWESSEASKQVSTKSIEIHIHGNVVDHAAFARELAPYISEAKGDKVSYGEQ